jgi:hypothetical protein
VDDAQAVTLGLLSGTPDLIHPKPAGYQDIESAVLDLIGAGA